MPPIDGALRARVDVMPEVEVLGPYAVIRRRSSMLLGQKTIVCHGRSIVLGEDGGV